MPSIPCWICPEGQRAGAGAGGSRTRQSPHGDVWVPQEWEEHCPPLAELDRSPRPSVAHPGHASRLRCPGHGRGRGPRQSAPPSSRRSARSVSALPSAETHTCPVGPHADGEVQKAGQVRGRIGIHGKPREAAPAREPSHAMGQSPRACGAETSSCLPPNTQQLVPPWPTSVAAPRYPWAPPRGAGRPQDRDRTPGEPLATQALSPPLTSLLARDPHVLGSKSQELKP